MTDPEPTEPAARTPGPTPPSTAPSTVPSSAAPTPPPTSPFVPRYREPWVNPAKKTTAIVIAAASAVVLLALGFLLGLGAGGGRHERGFPRPGVHAVMVHPGMFGAPGYRYRHPGFRRFRGVPGHRPGPLPPGTTPTRPGPVPSTSHS